jgi:hypothetical protein
MTSTEYEARVRAWAGLLRAGSSQTWDDFLASDDGGAAPLGAEVPLPGAAQLELVRRLAASAGQLADFERLADVVLTTAGPGRGLVDVPLPWPGVSDDGVRIGTPPVAPDRLTADELLRVAAGVLARLLSAGPPPPPGQRPRRWRPRRRGFALLGAPSTVGTVRAALLDQGLREGGSRTTWFVLGGPLEQLMAERWAARVRAGAGLRWQRIWRTAAANDRLPPGIALPTIAAHLAEELTPSRVHVVLGADVNETLVRVGEVLGVSLSPVPVRHDVLATDLLRRVNPVLGLAVGEPARRTLVDTVWPEIAADDGSAPLGAPAAQLDWAVGAGERMAGALSGGGYAVHGDPALVVPTRRPGVRRSPDPDDVLAHALVVLVRAWRRTAAGPDRASPDRASPDRGGDH